MPPPDLPGTGFATFAGLDPALPLALLPVRIETRFVPDGTPTELRVRLYPDTIHADGHAQALTDAELDLGRAFWERSWRLGADPVGQAAAFAWLSSQIGPWRAAFVAGAMTPTNADSAPSTALPDDQPLRPGPRFPKPVESLAPEPTRARLLPERFVVVAYAGEVIFGPYWGARIPAELAMAPAPVELEDGGEVGVRALLAAQGLSWTYDFDEAERIGMGVRIDLTSLDDGIVRRGFSELIAIGVLNGDQREPLEQLLKAHRYTHGIDLIPQGTPTTRTETAAPGLSLETPDLDSLRASELEHAVVERSQVEAEGDLFRMKGVDAISVALGLGRDNALDRASNAGLRELAWAEAMNRALWPALGGFCIDSAFGGILAGEDRAWLRDWSTRFVRGAAALPTLLIGSQPYGLQPATIVETPAEPAGRIEQLQTVLGELRLGWDGCVIDVPRLDPEWTDLTDDEGAEAGLVSQVLGALPHLTSLAVRRVDPLRSTYFGELQRRLGDIAIACMTEYDEEWPGPNYDDLASWAVWQRCDAALAAATSVREQLAALDALADGLDQLTQLGAAATYYHGWATWTRDALSAFVQAHLERLSSVEWLIDRGFGPTGLLGSLGDPIAFTTEHPEPDGAPWALPLAAEDHSAAAVTALARWLADLAADLAAGNASGDKPGDALPLLRQLIAWSTVQAQDPDDVALLRDGVGRDAASGLREVVGVARDPVAELERLLREALGPWSYRLDAWYTGLAAWRLENKRTTRARGIQTGAFGWVVDVHPRKGPVSQGYVLTPSLTHATTAAILRSGWAAFGGNGESAGLATNLSSERMRRATTIVDGVRAGQELGRLLGARLERRLVDAGLARFVEDVRQAVLDGLADAAPPNAIVDGLRVARARSSADDLDSAEQAVRAKLEELVAAADGVAGALGRVLDEASHDLDAAADAALAQSVFALAQGNVPEATASLTAASTGEVSFPRLRVADTPRSAQTITHRFVLCVHPEGGPTWRGAASSGRALAAPGIESWISGLLGAQDYDFAVSFEDSATGARLAGPFARTLSELNLAALDAVYLSPSGEETGLGRLGELIAGWVDALRPPELDSRAVAVVDATVGDRPLADLVTAARGLRRLLTNSRDLDARDLLGPGGEDLGSGLDSDALGARIEAIRVALEVARQALASALTRGRDVRAAVLGLAGFELGATPAGLDAEALAVHAGVLLSRIEDRLTDFEAGVAEDAEAWRGWDALARTNALRARAGLLIGHSVPLAPRFRATNGSELDATFARRRGGSREQASGWLAAAGRVEPGARRLRVAIDLTEAMRDDVLFEIAVGQLPDYPNESWAAIARPTVDTRGRLCLFVTGALPQFARADAAGIVFGALDESLPIGRDTAGIAVHFDAPSARAPQAVLLCTTRETWDFDVVRDTVKQTLDLARIRMLDLSLMVPREQRPVPSIERPPGIGQYLPATSLPFDVNAGGES